MFLLIKINIIDFRKDNIFMVVILLDYYFSWVWENEFCFGDNDVLCYCCGIVFFLIL